MNWLYEYLKFIVLFTQKRLCFLAVVPKKPKTNSLSVCKIFPVFVELFVLYSWYAANTILFNTVHIIESLKLENYFAITVHVVWVVTTLSLVKCILLCALGCTLGLDFLRSCWRMPGRSRGLPAACLSWSCGGHSTSVLSRSPPTAQQRSPSRTSLQTHLPSLDNLLFH